MSTAPRTLSIDDCPAPLLLVGMDGSIRAANKELERLFGYGPGELEGQPVEVLVPAETRAAHVGLRGAYLDAPTTRRMGSGRVLHGVGKAGNLLPVEVALDPKEIGGERCVVVSVFDLRVRLRTEERIRSQADQLRRSNSDLLQFAYSASHDLKAPLASIRGLLDICRLDLDDGETGEVRGHLDRCLELTDRLKDRVENLLDLARAEGQGGERTRVRLAELVGAVWRAVGAEGAQLDSRVDDDLWLWTERVRLESVLENLIVNAIRYLHRDRPVRIAVDAERSGEAVVLSIADNGIGIPDGDQAGIFSLFRRARNTRGSGAGMGLSLVQLHVAHLGGRIALRSSPDGTTFTITLPDGPAEEAPPGRTTGLTQETLP